MGSRASQLRNQQIRDSSAVKNKTVDTGSLNITDKRECNKISNEDDNNNNNLTHNNDQDVNADDKNLFETDRMKDPVYKEAVSLAYQVLQINGQLKQDADVQPANGEDSANNDSRKRSTLQRQATQIRSLAQRIRRSSSLRAPKLRNFIPSFVNGKRKASVDAEKSNDAAVAVVESEQQKVDQPETQAVDEQVVESHLENIVENHPVETQAVETTTTPTAATTTDGHAAEAQIQPQQQEVTQVQEGNQLEAAQEGTKEESQQQAEEENKADKSPVEQVAGENLQKAEEQAAEIIPAADEAKPEEQHQVETQANETPAAVAPQAGEVSDGQTDVNPVEPDSINAGGEVVKEERPQAVVESKVPEQSPLVEPAVDAKQQSASVAEPANESDEQQQSPNVVMESKDEEPKQEEASPVDQTANAEPKHEEEQQQPQVTEASENQTVDAPESAAVVEPSVQDQQVVDQTTNAVSELAVDSPPAEEQQQEVAVESNATTPAPESTGECNGVNEQSAAIDQEFCKVNDVAEASPAAEQQVEQPAQ